ncbi:MAG: hypothetical protein EU516_01855 [Promethearchaeota archaeon]|nr:MAG: hypothetical protein EU516_01855 [Candidatus Lokiarchaeota archaeon]
MEEQRFTHLVEKLNEFEGVEEAFLLDKDGAIIYKSHDFNLSNDEARSILTAWKEKEPALMYQGFRFAILKNDEIQLAAKNIVGGKGNIVGSITKEGDFFLAHTRDEGMILLEWSIQVNKIAWS